MEHDSWSETYAGHRPQSMDLYERARGCLAGGVGHDMRHSLPCPSYIAKASGARMWDVDGNEYIDYGMGNGALLLGHAPPEVLDAIAEALKDGYHYGQDHPLQVEWAELIQEMVPSAETIRFVNSGTEGTMLAIRLARAYTGREKLLRLEGHFNGWHDDVGRGTSPPFQEPASMGIPATKIDSILVLPAELNRIEDTLRCEDIAAVLLEPSGASWGTVPLTVEFNRELRTLTEQRGVPLIYDEVVTGFRYSVGGYQHYAGVTPDLTVMGKIVAGGMPGGVVAGRKEIMNLFDFTGNPDHDRYGRVWHLGTFNANPLSAAAGVATLRIARSGDAQERANQMAERLRRGMEEEISKRRIAGYVYGESSLFHIFMEAAPGSGAANRGELQSEDASRLKSIPQHLVTAVQKNLQIRGIELLSYTGGVTSAAHQPNDIDKTIEGFGESLDSLVEDDLLARLG
jgi:glutamate-1-semialdehyde 2,1-aminomutase